MNRFFTSFFYLRFNATEFDFSELRLPENLVKAPESRVKNILDFARSFHTMKTEENGTLEMHLN